MAQFTFKLSDIGEGITESEIATWRVAVGDIVKEDQPLVDMLTDKAAVELPSPVAGRVLKLCGQVGDKIPVGGDLLVIETAADAGNRESEIGNRAEAASAPIPAAPVAPTPTPAPAAEAVNAAPATVLHAEVPPTSPDIRRQAREKGVDLRCVPASGARGRITQADFDAYCEGRAAPSLPQVAPLTSEFSPRTPLADGVEEIKIIGLRRKIAESMQRAKQRIPHFAYVEEVDVTELEALRVHLNATKRADQPKLTLLPFLLKALVKAVPQFPQVNALFDDEANILRRYRALHVGIAAQTPQGLMVPVVRHAQAMDIWQAASEIQRLAKAAKDGKAKREELTGSTITISSLGPLGGIVSTPILNAPEVAIVGVNKMVERPMVRSGQIVVRQMMNLSSSFDHRIVDGHDAASFIQRIKQLLEHPATLFMP